MAFWKSLALTLRVIDYGETSQIATFFSRERGKVAAIAKGAKRKGSRFSGALEPLALVEIVCVKRREAAGLHTLTELDVRDTYRGARQDLERLYAASYVIELVRETAPEDAPEPALFDLASGALARIAGPAFAPLDVLAFEARALEILGHFPSLDACAECRAPCEGAARRFSAARGGVLCASCAANDRTARDASGGALTALLVLARDPEKAARLRVTPAQKQELRGLMNATMAAILERNLRTAKFLS
jgi:DNA repair protein RecO (recombination protein O)